MNEIAKSASVTIIQMVADRKGVDPIELAPPLTSVIDTDALDRLVGGGKQDGVPCLGVLQFEYCGLYVTVFLDDGTIIVSEHEQATAPAGNPVR